MFSRLENVKMSKFSIPNRSVGEKSSLPYEMYLSDIWNLSSTSLGMNTFELLLVFHVQEHTRFFFFFFFTKGVVSIWMQAMMLESYTFFLNQKNLGQFPFIQSRVIFAHDWPLWQASKQQIIMLLIFLFFRAKLP